MKINAHPVTESGFVGRFVQQIIEWPIDRGNFGNDANRARH
jgi:hypothetical protein